MSIRETKIGKKVKEFIYYKTEEAASTYYFLEMVWGKVFLGEIVRTLTLGNSKARGDL